jgi:hypothetical protein
MRHSVTAFARAIVLFCVLACAARTAVALPVTWTLSGAQFADGGTASGWFVYDADAQALTDFSVSVTGGDTATFPPITYSPANSNGFVADGGTGDAGTILSLSGQGETRGIRMPAVTPLTDAGGTLALNLAGRGQGECYNCGPARGFVAGSLVGTAAPAITSSASASFTVGVSASFTVTATGAPIPALSVTGALPSGIAFVDNADGTGTFSGAPGTAGTYALTITASNGAGADAVQPFSLVAFAPAPPVAAPTLGQFGLLVCGLLIAAIASRRLRAIVPRR